MRWFRRRRDRAHERRAFQLRMALDARANLLVAVDSETIFDVLNHCLVAVGELDAAIATLGELVYPHLADEIAARRPVFSVEDFVPEEWSA